MEPLFSSYGLGTGNFATAPGGIIGVNSLGTIFVIAVSLALDATSVSLAAGLKNQRSRQRTAVKLAAYFGGFQAGMPLIGWLIGAAGRGVVGAMSGWAAFTLLGLIGANMIRQALLDTAVGSRQPDMRTATIIVLAIATSIDALVVGVSLSLLGLSLWLSAGIIGGVTFVLCYAAFMFGGKVRGLASQKVEIVGGLVLIAVGLKLLAQSL